MSDWVWSPATVSPWNAMRPFPPGKAAQEGTGAEPSARRRSATRSPATVGIAITCSFAASVESHSPPRRVRGEEREAMTSAFEAACPVAADQQLGGEGLRVVRAGVPAVADEEGRCSAGTACLGTRNVGTDAASGLRVVDRADELLDVQLEVRGVPDEILELELVLVPEEQVVHVPEPALAIGGDGGPGGELRMRVDVGKRQVPEHVPQVVTEAFPEL